LKYGNYIHKTIVNKKIPQCKLALILYKDNPDIIWDMALIDDVRIKVKAGNGGNGAKSFLTITGNPKTFADGGNGGRGGSVYFQASNNISDLSQFRFTKVVAAKNGQNGMKKNLFGKKGEDALILVPPGTQIINESIDEQTEIIDLDVPILIAKGGGGGQGNHNYKPDARRYVPQNEVGGAGEEKDLHLILNLIADIGLIGLPNAGKSSLLKILTNATPKIGDYLFTTLEPNLGTVPASHDSQGDAGGGKIILADIPGLIEGASLGKGLGVKFLKHIEKTKILMHCIDAQDADILKTYETVRREFKEYSQKLLEKEEIILITKKDLVSSKKLKEQITLLKKFKRKIQPVSIYEETSINTLKELIESFKM